MNEEKPTEDILKMRKNHYNRMWNYVHRDEVNEKSRIRATIKRRNMKPVKCIYCGEERDRYVIHAGKYVCIVCKYKTSIRYRRTYDYTKAMIISFLRGLPPEVQKAIVSEIIKEIEVK